MLATLWLGCKKGEKVHYWAMILRLSWPRFNQSLKIIISNVQVNTCSVAYSCTLHT